MSGDLNDCVRCRFRFRYKIKRVYIHSQVVSIKPYGMANPCANLKIQIIIKASRHRSKFCVNIMLHFENGEIECDTGNLYHTRMIKRP